jgi:hypothetical protein
MGSFISKLSAMICHYCQICFFQGEHFINYHFNSETWFWEIKQSSVDSWTRYNIAVFHSWFNFVMGMVFNAVIKFNRAHSQINPMWMLRQSLESS